MTTERWILIVFVWLASTCSAVAQGQVDFRAQKNVRLEHRFTQDFGLAFMGAVILTNDFQRLGFAYGDVGLGYKISPNFGVNANYRQLFRRNPNGSYDKRHVLYADLDFAKSLPGPWSIAGTLRLQGQYYNHLFGEGYRVPNFYARTRLGIRYKINYYWQPFTESELFTPLFSPRKMLPDQLRYSIGVAFTFNRYVRVEIYEQVQKSLWKAPGSTFFLTAVNWGIRF